MKFACDTEEFQPSVMIKTTYKEEVFSILLFRGHTRNVHADL